MVECTWTLMIEKRDGHQVPGDGLMVYEIPVLGAPRDQLDKYFSIYGDDATISIDTATGANYHHQDGTDSQLNKIMSVNYDRDSIPSLFRIVTSSPFEGSGVVFSITIAYHNATEDF